LNCNKKIALSDLVDAMSDLVGVMSFSLFSCGSEGGLDFGPRLVQCYRFCCQFPFPLVDMLHRVLSLLLLSALLCSIQSGCFMPVIPSF
jgi:hypothetical protein